MSDTAFIHAVASRRAREAADRFSALVIKAGGAPVDPRVQLILTDLVARAIAEALDDIAGSPSCHRHANDA